MNQNQYAAKVTEIVDEQQPGFVYPADFEATIEAAFLRRQSPEDAAETVAYSTGDDHV